jgi:site-specific recombinase XerD
MTLAGVPLNIIKAVLGHKNLSSTTVYLNISSEYAEDMLKEKGLI